jgi:SAM-dependent methyltransferase
MQKDINQIIDNRIVLNKNHVWELEDKKTFHYSEGFRSENYLKKVLSTASDLSSDSYELEQWIRHWPSEYHLSRKRSQLLKGFNIDKSKRVLEVGCGCGAITRFLGEKFDEVVAVEGSIIRADLARMRTKELDNVTILCAPFQDIKFKEPFDIIFCIGVFEYSNIFVESEDPFNYILKYFSDILKADGEIVIAIENQFGLKYFSSSKEDHTEVMYDGLEGYHRFPGKEKTFGYNELKWLIERYFNSIEFYFPYPDYKTPSCILSEKFLCKFNTGELSGNFHASRFLDSLESNFDEKLVLIELGKNKMLPFFSNSFLIVAGKQSIHSMKLNCLGLIFNNRVKKFQTETIFKEKGDGGIIVDKTLPNGLNTVEDDLVVLHKVQSDWIEGLTLHGQILQRVKDRESTVENIFALSKIWIEKLRSLSKEVNGDYYLEGKYLDCLWSNSFIIDGDCKFIDLEWEWQEKIKLNVLLIRNLYIFLIDISSMTDLNPALKKKSRYALIKRISQKLGVEIKKSDFQEFCELEARFDHIAYGEDYKKSWYYVYLSLKHKLLLTYILKVISIYRKIYGKITRDS